MNGVLDMWKRSGGKRGKKHGITREKQGQEIPSIYETSLSGRLEANGDINRKHVRAPKGWYSR
jgi:hypothetical protein